MFGDIGTDNPRALPGLCSDTQQAGVTLFFTWVRHRPGCAWRLGVGEGELGWEATPGLRRGPGSGLAWLCRMGDETGHRDCAVVNQAAQVKISLDALSYVRWFSPLYYCYKG